MSKAVDLGTDLLWSILIMRALLFILPLLFALPAAAGVEGARDAFAKGKAAVEAGEQREARQHFEEAASQAPTWILPALELAELAVSRREGGDGARARLVGVVRSGLQNPRYHRLLGDLDQLAGDDEGAVVGWRRSLELLPRQEEVRLGLASTLERLGRHEEAVVEYERLLVAKPFDLIYRARLAYALEQAEQYDRALEELKQLIKRQPGQEAPIRRLARFHERRGDEREAKRLHAQADWVGEREAPRKLRPLPPSRR